MKVIHEFVGAAHVYRVVDLDDRYLLQVRGVDVLGAPTWVGDVYGRALGGDDLPQRVVVSEIFANGQIHIMADGHERSCSNWRLFLASIPGLAQIGRVRMHGPCMICGAPMRRSDGFRVCGNGHASDPPLAKVCR